MKITIKRGRRHLPIVRNWRDVGAKKNLLLLAFSLLLLAGCTHEEIEGGGPDTPPGQNEVIRFEIGFAPQTRVATAVDFTSVFEDGDEIGVFAVKSGTSLSSTAADNYMNNVKLIYNSANGGSWSGVVYWPTASSGITTLDFYAYYPYDVTATNPTAITFHVKTDQSGTTDGKNNYNLSDLLTAKSDNGTNGYGKGETVSLTFSHALAMVQVSVSKSMIGDYPPEALTVTLRGCTADAGFDLRNAGTTDAATASTTTDPVGITMYPCPEDDASGTFAYRALVPATELEMGTAMFMFNYNDTHLLRSQPLSYDLTLRAGEANAFDIPFPFTSFTVSSGVRLSELIAGMDAAALTDVRILGEMTDVDFTTIGINMPNISRLDLGGATVVGNAIPHSVFYGKKSLKEFVFPKDITSIDASAFRDCSGLTGSLVIPEGVTSIGASAFQECSGFTGSLVIPEDVTSIGVSAFRNCSGFTGSLMIPANVTSIGLNAFLYCTGFTSLNFEANSQLKTMGRSAFQSCSGFTGSLAIPEGVMSIGASVFYGCSGFNGSLTIPASITSIGNNAFWGCGFSSVTSRIPNPKTVNYGTDVFSGISTNITLYVPAGTVDIYKGTSPWNRWTEIRQL